MWERDYCYKDLNGNYLELSGYLMNYAIYDYYIKDDLKATGTRK